MNEKRIRRLVRLMGLMPIYQKPNTSKPAKGHKIDPYLLRGLRVGRPDQVWCADITYLPPLGSFALQNACRAMDAARVSVSGGDPSADRRLPSSAVRHGLANPVALSWRISNTLDADFCVEALSEAIHGFGPPDTRNTGSGLPVCVVCLDRPPAKVRISSVSASIARGTFRHSRSLDGPCLSANRSLSPSAFTPVPSIKRCKAPVLGRSGLWTTRSFWRQLSLPKFGTGQSSPANRRKTSPPDCFPTILLSSRLVTITVVFRHGSPNSAFSVRQAGSRRL
ncbi:MAG: hypothetical protein IPL38_00660 [Rhodobacter sp.]|nr:hypothetical protein [Rhodobacter sp.]